MTILTRQRTLRRGASQQPPSRRWDVVIQLARAITALATLVTALIHVH
jgi:hypothetical protein